MSQSGGSLRKPVRFPDWSVPVALLVLTVVAYGLMIPFLGLYQDDRYMTWYAKAFGARIFIPFFARERPALGYLYMLTTSLVGWSTLAWHVFALGMRWLASLAAWWSLRQVWPKQREAAVWVAFFLTVYPGFQQHFVVMGYSHVYIRLAALLFSFGLSAFAARRPKLAIPLSAAAFLLAGVGILPSEYFFAVELIRPILLWVVFQDLGYSWKPSLKRALWHWLPFFLLMAGFTLWRIFIIQFPTYQPALANDLAAHPFGAIIHLARTVLWDAVEAGFLVWDLTLHPYTLGENIGASTWLSLLLGIAVAFGATIYLNRLRADENPPDAGWRRAAIALGGFSLLWVGAPFWFAGLQVELDIPYDRVTLPFMFSASLLWAGLVDWLAGSRLKKILLVSVAVGLAAGAQFRMANSFRLAYEAQKTILTQLLWRAPDLEPGTLVISNEISSAMNGDNSFAATLNWIYDQQPVYPEMEYVWLFVPQRVGKTLPSLEAGVKVEKMFRSLTYRGSTDQAVVIYYSPPGCLRLLDPQVDSQFPGYPPAIAEALPLSNQERIRSQPDSGVSMGYEQLFGPIPEKDWCYYFEKADLARQTGAWKEVVQLGDLALALPPVQHNPKEFLPYIEGYAHQGQWEKALMLSRQLFRSLPKAQGMLCAVWERIETETAANPDQQTALSKIQMDLECQGSPPAAAAP